MKKAERESKISVKAKKLNLQNYFTEIFNSTRKYVLIVSCYLDAHWKSPVTSRQMEGGR